MDGVKSGNAKGSCQIQVPVRILLNDYRSKLSVTTDVFALEPAIAVRSSVVDARGTLQLGYDTDSGSEKQDRETEKFSSVHQGR